MKKILILLSLFIFGTASVSYAAEKGSKAQITFENEYIPSGTIPSGHHGKDQINGQETESTSTEASKSSSTTQKAGTLPQTNEHQNNWAIYGSLIFLGSLWLIKRRSNK